MAEENSLYDIDINKEAFSIDGIYDDSFLSSNLADHRHLSSDKTAFFCVLKIKNLINTINSNR